MLIVKLAVFAGMRPGEIFGLKWRSVRGVYADISQRVYREFSAGVHSQPPLLAEIGQRVRSQSQSDWQRSTDDVYADLQSAGDFGICHASAV